MSKVLGLDVVPGDEAGRCSRDLEWAADILFGDKSYTVTRDSDGDRMWVRAASTVLLGCMLHPGLSALQQGVNNFRQRKGGADKVGGERGRLHWTLERAGAVGSDEHRQGEGLSGEEGGDDATAHDDQIKFCPVGILHISSLSLSMCGREEARVKG